MQSKLYKHTLKYILYYCNMQDEHRDRDTCRKGICNKIKYKFSFHICLYDYYNRTSIRDASILSLARIYDDRKGTHSMGHDDVIVVFLT